MSRGLALALKAAVSGSLILYLFSRVDLVSVREAACRAHPEWIALAICLHVVGLGLSAYRWRSLLSIFHQGYRYGYLVRSLLSGLFFNQFLPSTIGGDALRAYQTPSRKGERIPAVGVVFVERSIGLIVLLVVGSIAALIVENPVSNVLRYPFLILAFGFLAVVWGVTRFPIGEREERESGGIGPLRDKVRRFIDAVRAYRGQGRVIGRAMVATILLQVNVILCWGVLARALEINVSPESFFLVIPALALVLLLPVSINGIGLRENGLLALLVPLGVGAPEVVAIAWVDYAIQLGWGAVGGVVYVFHRRTAGLEGART
ncbi:MAG: hypothetical protein A2V83_02435 [Nitrospirae bacterium RBG_16_64_22]|nr:MAG: hypothetical protein A2V83_02435 [Nitrospirae bacterium RBG_16_64_22]